MIETFGILIPFLIADVLNPVLFAFMVYAAGTRRPVVTSSAVLLGHTAAYFGAGIVIALGLEKITHYLANPSSVHYLIALIVGLLLLWLAFPKAKKTETKRPEDSGSMTPLSAFGLGSGDLTARVGGEGRDEVAASGLARERNQPLAAILSNAQAARRFLDSDRPDPVELREILSELPTERRQIRVRTERHGDEVVKVTIEDAGPGIAPEELSTVFEPFFTTRSGGLGMGLAICRRIVEAHGGRIWGENTGDGARFSFTLPLAKPDQTNG